MFQCQEQTRRKKKKTSTCMLHKNCISSSSHFIPLLPLFPLHLRSCNGCFMQQFSSTWVNNSMKKIQYNLRAKIKRVVGQFLVVSRPSIAKLHSNLNQSLIWFERSSAWTQRRNKICYTSCECVFISFYLNWTDGFSLNLRCLNLNCASHCPHIS